MLANHSTKKKEVDEMHYVNIIVENKTGRIGAAATTVCAIDQEDRVELGNFGGRVSCMLSETRAKITIAGVSLDDAVRFFAEIINKEMEMQEDIKSSKKTISRYVEGNNSESCGP
jgi:hypothetical protein